MKVIFLGVALDSLSFQETVDRARDAIVSRTPTHQVSLNVAKLVKMRTDPVLREDVSSSDIVSADGMGIILACRILGIPLHERVAGIDLMDAVLCLCAKNGFRPYFLGATAEVLERATAKAQMQYPGLEFAGMRNGYFKNDEETNIVKDILSSKPDCLFIGMPTPRKERFLSAHKHILNIPFIMGVGGSFDILAGAINRAPQWMQSNGLEWLYRIYQEPRRMWYRYVSTNAAFVWMLVVAVVQSSFQTNRSSKV